LSSFFVIIKPFNLVIMKSKTHATVTHFWSYTREGIARIEQAGEITVIAIYAARKYTVLCSLSDVAAAESPHQAAFTSFTDSNFRPTKERFTDAFNLFLSETVFSSFSGPYCRLSYPSAVSCSCANEMNVQKRECPRRMQFLEKEKKCVYRACNIWSRFHRIRPFFPLKTFNFHS